MTPSPHSEYSPITLGNGAKVSVRVVNHHGNALLFLAHGNNRDAIDKLQTAEGEDVKYSLRNKKHPKARGRVRSQARHYPSD